MEIVWRDVAILSLERARAYIAKDNPSAAQRVYDRILRPVRNLADMPNMGRPGRVEDTRELLQSFLTRPTSSPTPCSTSRS